MKEYFTQNELMKKKGLTMKMIKVYLGAPDKRENNNQYSEGRPIKLYAVVRVNEAEGKEEFIAWMKKLIDRRAKRDAAKGKLFGEL